MRPLGPASVGSPALGLAVWPPVEGTSGSSCGSDDRLRMARLRRAVGRSMTDPQAESRGPVDLERNARLIEQLYRNHRAALCSVARRQGIAADQVDDVVQSAMAAVLGAYRGPAEADQLFSYTATAVRNCAWKAHRRHGRKESHLAAMPTHQLNDRVGTDQEVAFIDPEASDPADLVVLRETLEAERKRLAKLPEIEREILVLGAAGYGNREIAAIVGLSERAVRKRVTRARRRLYEQPE